MLLAFVVDDSLINWIIGTVAVTVPPSIATTIVMWKKLIAFLKPKIERLFDAHSGLVEEMKTQVPVVSQTLAKLGDTQDKQCQTLEQHGKILESHDQKMETILSVVRKSNPCLAAKE